MKLKELEGKDRVFSGICHDCCKHVEVKVTVNKEEGTITIEGGSVYKVKEGLEERLFFKCESCFKNDHTLRNWKQCEVYSRVVGYLRPINQWNKGKKAEYDQRVDFINVEKYK